MEFKRLSDHRTIDIINYIGEYLKNHENIELLIGCDSQNKRKDTTYAVVIGLYKPGKGAHVLYHKFSIPRVRDNYTRLWKEVELSIEVATQIKNELGIVAKYIDIDLNPDPKYKSNSVLAGAEGMIKSLGFNVRNKGEYPMLTYGADHIVR